MARSGGRTRRDPRLLVWFAGTAVVLVTALVGSAIATDASSFCKSCHEMRPYYTAWAAGAHGHEGVACVDCHVDPGFVARLAHKPVALLEVWAHFFGNSSFPLATSPQVPDSRCIRCHAKVTVDRKNFSHELHARKGSCQDCHAASGHSVSTDALKAAGIFNPGATRTPLTLKVAVVSGGKANLPGHVAVVCSTCHDLETTGCRACHETPRKHAAAAGTRPCSDCHRTGTAFVFTHPVDPGDCAACHKPPLEHPNQARDQACALCHRSTSTWAFAHPQATASCVGCHRPPGKHPGQASGKACAVCHQPGGSWGFRHPASSARCTQCHSAPTKHYGSGCVSCHRRPGVSWAFSHPSTREHSWRSFACAKCHPSSYSRAYCTCHDGQPPTDD